MLTPQRARENVLSALASASSCFGNWQTSLDAVRLFMYQKDEPLASTARYFERHSRKDWSPVRRFTGRCLAQCLRSRMAVSLFTNVPFLETPAPTPLVMFEPQPHVTFGHNNAAYPEKTHPDDMFFDVSEISEPEVNPLASSSAEEGSALAFLFPDPDLLLTSPTSSPTPPSHYSKSAMLSQILQRRRAPSSDSPYGGSDDDVEPVKAPPQYFVPISEGSGLSHVFCNHDISSALSTKNVPEEYSCITFSSTNSLETSAATTLSSLSAGPAKIPHEGEDDEEQEDSEAGEESEDDELVEQNERLEEENAILNDVRRELERENADLDVEVKVQNRSIKRHMETNSMLEKEINALKSHLAQRDAFIFGEIRQLKREKFDLAAINDGLEDQLENMANEIADRDVKISNYEKVFQRYRIEWKGACENIEELRQVIEAFPDHTQPLLEAITKRDERIARLKESLKTNRICDKALKRAYPRFAAKYNEVVGLANDRLDLGVFLSQRLAEVEAYLLREGHASPLSDRDVMWEEVYNVFRINESGDWDQNKDGEYLVVAREMEVADNPDGWLPGFFEKIWREEDNVDEGGGKACADGRPKLTWLDGDKHHVVETEEKTSRNLEDHQDADGVDDGNHDNEVAENDTEAKNEDGRGEAFDQPDANTEKLNKTDLTAMHAIGEDLNAAKAVTDGDDGTLIHYVPKLNESNALSEPTTFSKEVLIPNHPGRFTVPSSNENEDGDDSKDVQNEPPFSNIAKPEPEPQADLPHNEPASHHPKSRGQTSIPQTQRTEIKRTGNSKTHKRNAQRARASQRCRALKKGHQETLQEPGDLPKDRMISAGVSHPAADLC